ncbi:LytTR family DNA-binding domain-containing protein [Clostridium sp.]|uniref:LytR/AlgR family response regulator transcription factor n=1 Tax=Clostridium sp. TaxID=1506 RepID=UPI00261E215F|nr:LytTR family DNA-binding domain-containing protein [Clostridium sp.]
MISIAICDDEQIQRNMIKNMILQISQDNNMGIIIDEFKSGKDFLSVFKKNTQKYNLIFCDIIMGEISGIELLKVVKSMNSSIQAILITSCDEFVFEGYDLGVLNYLMKPVSRKKLEREFLRAIKNINHTSPSVYTVHSNGGMIFIDLSEVLYFEVNNKTITANFGDRTVEFNMKIKDLENDLKDRNFFRCHRSFLANMAKVDSILQNKILFQNRMDIPIGRLYKKSLKEYLLSRTLRF